MTVYLDGGKMTGRGQTHAYLKEALSLPEHYGNNLDALYDVLTERGEPTLIVLENIPQMRENLGRYGKLLLETISQAAIHNPNLEFQTGCDI